MPTIIQTAKGSSVSIIDGGDLGPGTRGMVKCSASFASPVAAGNAIIVAIAGRIPLPGRNIFKQAVAALIGSTTSGSRGARAYKVQTSFTDSTNTYQTALSDPYYISIPANGALSMSRPNPGLTVIPGASQWNVYIDDALRISLATDQDYLEDVTTGVAGDPGQIINLADSLGQSYQEVLWVDGGEAGSQFGDELMAVFYLPSSLAGSVDLTFVSACFNEQPFADATADLCIIAAEITGLPHPEYQTTNYAKQGNSSGDLEITLPGVGFMTDFDVQDKSAAAVANLFGLGSGTDFLLALATGDDLAASTPTLASGGTYSLIDSITSANGLPLYLWITLDSPPRPSPAALIPPAWLVINEPSLGYTDRTQYLCRTPDNKHSWTLQMRERGQASIDLEIPAGDSYAPTRLTQAFLFDELPTAIWTLVWSGLIQDIDDGWVGFNGDRRCLLKCVSFESVFDTVYVTKPVQYVNKSCGYIFADLFNRFESGCPVILGTVEAGEIIPLFNANVGDFLSALFSQLATTSLFAWGCNPATLEVFFQDPTNIAAPFSLTDALAHVPGSSPFISLAVNGGDYRNRQGVKLSPTAFEHSKEFFVGAGQTEFTLRRPLAQVTNAWATLSTCNTATGSFSTQPAPGDTVTIGPAAGVRQSSHVYALDGIIIVDGFVQKITFAGTTASSAPTFSEITGGTTTDGSAIWTCQGPAGISTGVETYTFVAALDNREFGQVLIGSTIADTCQNLVDAINANADVRGVNFSLPTWENSHCNAVGSVGAVSFTLQQKSAGSGWVSDISSHTDSSPYSLAFIWDADHTFGGTSPQGSLGPGEGATISLQVYEEGTSTAAPALVYVKGALKVHLATPLNVGSNLNVEYVRADAGIIEVEDTALVTALAALSHGTGKYMQITDAGSQGLIATSREAGLQLAQQALAAYSTAPVELQPMTFKPGLFPGMTITVGLTKPAAAISRINGDWVISEISAEFLLAKRYFGTWGHYRYTLRLVNLSEISVLWRAIGGGSSGSGGGAGGGATLVATSGGALHADSGIPNFADNETPSGTINGSNVTFTLAHTPLTGSLELYLNGVEQLLGTDYTLSTATITMTVAPKSDQPDVLKAWYRY